MRVQTKWETRQEQVDLIGRGVEFEGPNGYGVGGGFGTVIAFRRTTDGPQVKVRRLYGQPNHVCFLRQTRAANLGEPHE